MKSTGTIEAGTGFWYSPNEGATNSSGFTALPGGWQNNFLGYYAPFWTSTEHDLYNARFWRLATYDIEIHSIYNGKTQGYSVRCILD
jgi:uncharacterized protein (TIGR02145 family)